MFPSRISIYRFSRELSLASLNDLEAAISMQSYRELGKLERACDGFVCPMPEYREGHYALVVGHSELTWHREFQLGDTLGCMPKFNEGQFDFAGFGRDADALVLRYYREEKNIVTSDIKRKVNAEVRRLEKEGERKVYAKERGELKHKFIEEVLPHAQAKYQEVPIVFLSAGYVVIGAVGKLAEQACDAMRQVLGTFPVSPLRTKLEVYTLLTGIARAQVDLDYDRFRITSDFQMQETHEHPAVARCKNTDIKDENIQGFMRDGKVVTHADMTWDDKVRFSLDPKLNIRKLRVDDAVFDQADGEEDEELDMAGVNYASSMIEADLVLKMLVELIDLLGGEVMPVEVDGQKPQPLLLDGLTDNQHAKRAEAEEREGEEEAE